MLLDLRRDLVDQGLQGFVWKSGMSLWATGFASSSLYGFGTKMARFATQQLPIKSLPAPLNGWTDYREIPHFVDQSFADWWNERIQDQDDER
jgi:hypothetical protein